jgi:hypothetical protein
MRKQNRGRDAPVLMMYNWYVPKYRKTNVTEMPVKENRTEVRK